MVPKRKQKKVYKKPKASNKTKSKAFVKKVRRALKVESKEAVAGFALNVKGNNSASIATTGSPDYNILRVDPNETSMQIQQGVQQNQRVGNKIRLTYGTMEMALWPRLDTAGNTNNLQYIRMVCFYDKQKPTETPTPFANLDFFQQSSATGFMGFTGQMYDLVNKINTDRYHVFWERTFKLGPAVLTGSGSADPAYANQANNDFKAFYKRKFSLGKTCIKNLCYRDNYPQGQWRGCWIIVFGVAATAYGNVANVNVANMYGQIRWKYIDV